MKPIILPLVLLMVLMGCAGLVVEQGPQSASAIMVDASQSPVHATAGAAEPSPEGRLPARATATVVVVAPTIVLPRATPTPLPGVPTSTPDPGAPATAAALATLVQAATATRAFLLTAVPVTATPTPVVPQPAIESFTLHTARLAPGAAITASWTVRGARQRSLCYDYYGAGDRRVGGGCLHALPPVAAKYAFTLEPAEVDVYYVDFALNAVNGAPQGENVLVEPLKEDRISTVLPATCPYPWFHRLELTWCALAEAADYPGAVAQRFEQGLALYLPPRQAMPNRVIVLYDDGRATRAMAAPQTTVPADLEVPPGFHAPARQFYSLWSADSSVLHALRDTLGWATAAPQTFTAREQCAEAPPAYAQLCYLTGPGQTLYAVDGLAHRWEPVN